MPELLSNFLGVGVLRRGDDISEMFYECDLSLCSEGGNGGNSDGIVQPLASEIHLPWSQTISLSISTHFRLMMWLVLSGAVRRASKTTHKYFHCCWLRVRVNFLAKFQ